MSNLLSSLQLVLHSCSFHLSKFYSIMFKVLLNIFVSFFYLSLIAILPFTLVNILSIFFYSSSDNPILTWLLVSKSDASWFCFTRAGLCMCLLISVVSLHLAELHLWKIRVSKLVLLGTGLNYLARLQKAIQTRDHLFLILLLGVSLTIRSVICIADPSDARSVVEKWKCIITISIL